MRKWGQMRSTANAKVCNRSICFRSRYGATGVVGALLCRINYEYYEQLSPMILLTYLCICEAMYVRLCSFSYQTLLTRTLAKLCPTFVLFFFLFIFLFHHSIAAVVVYNTASISTSKKKENLTTFYVEICKLCFMLYVSLCSAIFMQITELMMMMTVCTHSTPWSAVVEYLPFWLGSCWFCHSTCGVSMSVACSWAICAVYLREIWLGSCFIL